MMNKKSTGFTLIELTVVISVILILVAGSLFVSRGYTEYLRGVEAGEILKQIYAAQREYLADRPFTDTSAAGFTLDLVTIEQYLPRSSDFFDSLGDVQTPVIQDPNGNNLTITFSVPPRLSNDLSGEIDGVWDPGQ